MKKDVRVLFPKTNMASFIDAVLKHRGVDASEIGRNMSSIEDPMKIKDGLKAGQRIVDSIQRGEFITFYTDYDADGFGCGVVETALMRAIPYDKFDVFFNKRDMGFGMNKKGIDIILQKHPDTKLIITSDNGIVAFDAVDYANSKGIDVIITDHHIPDEDGRLPNAYAVVDPHREDETCQYREYCGTGLIFKVFMIVYYLLGISISKAYDVLDIVAVATIADVVPLTGENRIFAKIGLKKMSDECRPQWGAFKKLGSTYEPLLSFSSKDVGFFVGPCINAASRMNGDISEPLAAFVDTKPEHVFDEIENLVKINNIRKEVQKYRSEQALEMIEEVDDAKCIVIDMPVCEEGVVGLVAGNVCNQTYRPTIVLSPTEDKNWKGSGRSIPGVHIKSMLDHISKNNPGILLAYGGHSQACGLTIAGDKVEEFRQAANDYCNQFEKDTFIQKIIVDYVVHDPSELPRLHADKVSMEPYGCDFQEPVVMIRFKPDETKIVKEGKHLIFRYKGIDIISWNSGYKMIGKDPGSITQVTAVGSIDNDHTINCQPELLSIKF